MSKHSASHPAKYSDALLPLFERLLDGYPLVLDPFAGVGKLQRLGICSHIVLNELESECAIQGPADTIGDTLHLPYADGVFDAICTSPSYGNRMGDHHDARDGSKRNTYRHTLGRPLHPANLGQLQWGQDYRDFHIHAWKECGRVLQPGGRFILNISDHIRQGELIEVSNWHKETLEGLGFIFEERYEILPPRLRYGQNGNLRVESEYGYFFRASRSKNPPLRIAWSIRYNDSRESISPHKASARSVRAATRRLTQPTGLAADWAGSNYTNPAPLRPGGIHRGVSDSVLPESRLKRPSYKGANMLTNTLPVILTRFNMVDTLIQIRQEWEQAAEGKSLVDVQGSVGLLLADVVAALGLGASDQVLVLGPELHANLQDILVGPENGKGS